MQMLLRFSVFALAYFHPVYGSADLSLMKDFVGAYPILSLNGDRTIAGKAEIIADERGIGYTLTPLKGVNSTVPNKSVIISLDSSNLTKIGNTVSHEYTIDRSKQVVLYIKKTGYIEITSNKCPIDSRCSKEELELGAGGSSGTPLSSEGFCDTILGTYFIESANGVKPKPEAELATVEKDVGTKECIFTFPYCIPDSSCDPGFLFFGFGATNIYRNNTESPTHTTFTVLSQENSKPTRYTWSMDNGKLRFINYQYVLPSGERVTLEHTGLRKVD